MSSSLFPPFVHSSLFVIPVSDYLSSYFMCVPLISGRGLARLSTQSPRLSFVYWPFQAIGWPLCLHFREAPSSRVAWIGLDVDLDLCLPVLVSSRSLFALHISSTSLITFAIPHSPGLDVDFVPYLAILVSSHSHFTFHISSTSIIMFGISSFSPLSILRASM